jgi:hypothetical protein
MHVEWVQTVHFSAEKKTRKAPNGGINDVGYNCGGGLLWLLLWLWLGCHEGAEGMMVEM